MFRTLCWLLLGLSLVPQAARAQAFLGTRSCSAAACHGGVAPSPGKIRRNEFTLWLEYDPHAHAHRSLDNQLGLQILTSLGVPVQNRSQDARFQNCLACHNPTQPHGPGVKHDATVREGVSCEACHGPAKDWQANHFRAGFVAAKSGMIQTKTLAVRAAVCVDCHVGSSDREVNHDLIAAGHPPLKFELSAYHDQMPRHWKKPAVTPQNDDQAIWAAGQKAAAKGALELLAARARRTGDDAVWPEFAESNCFSCHHDLVGGGWRPQKSYGTAIVVPTWGSWYFSLWPKSEPLDALKQTLQTRLIPDAKDVASRTEQALAAAPADGSLAALDRLVELLDEKAAPSKLEDWDVATQVYLRLVSADFAFHEHRGAARPSITKEDREITRLLKSIRTGLAFPKEHASPANFTAADQDQTAKQVRLELSSVYQLIRQRASK